MWRAPVFIHWSHASNAFVVASAGLLVVITGRMFGRSRVAVGGSAVAL